MLVSVESTDKFAVDCSAEEFRTIDASLYQVLHRTAAHEEECNKQTRTQKGFEERRVIVRRCDQRNMSVKNSAHADLISNVSERDRAKDVEQLDDVKRTFINETNKFENRFGTVRNEEKMLAVN